MTDREKKAAAKEFVRHWAGKGDEKQHTQLYILGHGVGFIIFYFLLSIYYKMLMNKWFPQINA